MKTNQTNYAVQDENGNYVEEEISLKEAKRLAREIGEGACILQWCPIEECYIAM